MKAGKDFIGVGCGVFIYNEKAQILLQKRSKKSKNEVGLWNKMGGAVEFGETIEEALKREAFEEVGVEITDIEFLSYTDHILLAEKQHWLGMNFMARIGSGIPKNMEPEKQDEIRWFKFDEVPQHLAMPTKESLPLMVKRYQEKFGKV